MITPEIDFSKILNSQMRALSRRSRSVSETRERLRLKEIPEEMIEDVIARLIRYGFLDDQRYAKEFVRSKMRGGYGLLRIRRELKARGVDGSSILAALEDEDNDLSEEVVFQDVLEKRIRSKGEPEDLNKLKSLSDFLLRRGFPQEMVRKNLGPYFNKVFR